MRKIFLSFLVLILLGNSTLSFGSTPPDEGMWLPMLVDRLNHADMQKYGLRLTAEELYSINKSSLKDAIVQIGGFCTAEVISKEGLLLTNHHCAYGAIQAASSIQHDYLTNGFWAANHDEEIPTDISATFLVRMEDVTSIVLEGVDYNTPAKERGEQIRKAINKLKKDNSEGGKYTVDVKDFFEGNEYYMFVYEVYDDVRLVGAPPSSVGKFGGDTDNWIWPRHTGDFSLLRVYTAKDGSPAKYSKDNVPLVPRHHLPISIKGVQQDDFVMIWGYPGSTDRYLTSWGVEEVINDIAPTVVSVREKKLEIMRKDMDASDAVRIQYAAKYAQVANYWKYFIGQRRGLINLNVVEKKREIESEFAKWVDQDSKRKEIYGNVLAEYEKAYKEYAEKQIQKRFWYFQEVFTGAESLFLVWKLQTMPAILKKKDIKESDFDAFKGVLEEHFKDYNMETDKKLFAAMLEMNYKNIPQEYHPTIFAELNKKYKGNFEKLAEEAYKKSIVVSQENFEKFTKKPSQKAWDNDIVVKISRSMIENYFALQQEMSAIDAKLKPAKRLFVDALRQIYKDKKFAPDANMTMRMTYGQVLDYIPADGVHYNFYTTQQGILEKEDPNNDEFVVPAKLKELIEKKDFGRYGKNGELAICFIANTDITGGNSGSPMINADGHLVGCAFDGNWEAMSGDIAFEPELQRTIGVDARYILFIIDKYAGAQNLINEMTIIE